MADKRRAFERTSYEVRRSWDKENLKTLTIRLHKTNDAPLIDYINQKREAGIGMSEMFREAMDLYIEHNK